MQEIHLDNLPIDNRELGLTIIHLPGLYLDPPKQSPGRCVSADILLADNQWECFTVSERSKRFARTLFPIDPLSPTRCLETQYR